MQPQPHTWPLERATPESVGLDAERLRTVDRLVESWVADGTVAGGMTLAARRGRIAQLGVFGRADIERDLPMREDALFRIYSMTKPITCVAVLMLYEACAFLLDDPVKAYLPELADLRVRVPGGEGAEETVRPRRDVTIHDLLTHVGGLSYAAAREAVRGGWTPEEFLHALARVPLNRHPGEQWDYSASNDVLGCLVERLSGLPLDAFFEQRIFRPLGMTDTFFFVPPEKRARLAALYTQDADGRLVRQASEDYLSEAPPKGRRVFLSGGGGLVSSTADYLRFCLMLLHDGAWNGTRLLGRKTVELMRTDHLPPGHPAIEPFKFGYGLGVSVLRSLAEKQGIGSIGEFGWGGAASTEAWIDPQEDLVTIVMFQLRPTRAEQLTKKIKQAVYQAIVD